MSDIRNQIWILKFIYWNRYWFTWFLVYSKPKTILLH